MYSDDYEENKELASEHTKEVLDDEELKEAYGMNSKMEPESKKEELDMHMYYQGMDYFDDKVPWEEIVKQELDKNAAFMQGYKAAKKEHEEAKFRL